VGHYAGICLIFVAGGHLSRTREFPLVSHGHPGRPLVLIVDEVMVRMLIADVLQVEGYKIIEGKDATEAVRLLEARPNIQVLVIHIEMPPGPTGYDLARQTRNGGPMSRSSSLGAKVALPG